MRRCDLRQLTIKPFAAGDIAVAVAGNGHAHEVSLGGAGMAGERPVLTLFLSSQWQPLTDDLTVNLLPLGRKPGKDATMADLHLEPGQQVDAPRVADARLAFECRVLGKGAMQGPNAFPHVLLVEVLGVYQRWPRGCAIT